MFAPVEGGFSKQARLTEGGEQDDLTPFFRLPAILPSSIPSTSQECANVVAIEVLDFIRGLSATDRQKKFAYASRTLFRIESLISIVDVGQDDILCSIELSREQNEMRERSEVLE